MELLPLEILYLIIEKMDAHTFVNCLSVSRKWKYITLRIANTDKKNLKWQSIYEFYHEDESFKVKSNKLLSFKELFANSLRWNLNFSFSLSDTCVLNHVKKINIYRDNIIVIDSGGVKYYDVKTHEIKRQLEIAKCVDFNERDAFILKVTADITPQVNLFLYDKSSPDDNESAIQLMINDVARVNNSILIRDVNHYMLEKNSCYVLYSCNILACYTWKVDTASKIRLTCDLRNLGRYYGYRDDIPCAMNVLNSEVFLLTKWGKMIYYCYEKRNFQEVTRIPMPQDKSVFVRIVHKYCVVIGVPSNCEFRITRFRNNEGYNFYRFECPNLTCVTQHGEMLFLGFSDGKIELFMPRAPSREAMFKRRIHISDLKPGPIDPEDLIVISIDVFEDFKEHHLFIATYSSLYHLVITHPDEICVWDNIPERVEYYKYPIRTRYVL